MAKNIPVNLDSSQDHLHSKEAGLHAGGNWLIPWTISSYSPVVCPLTFGIKQLLHTLLTRKGVRKISLLYAVFSMRLLHSKLSGIVICIDKEN